MQRLPMRRAASGWEVSASMPTEVESKILDSSPACLTHGALLRGVRAANNLGVSGPNSTTVQTGVSVAQCAGPLSLITSTSARVYNTSNCRNVVLHTRQVHRGESTRRVSSRIGALSLGAPCRQSSPPDTAPTADGSVRDTARSPSGATAANRSRSGSTESAPARCRSRRNHRLHRPDFVRTRRGLRRLPGFPGRLPVNCRQCRRLAPQGLDHGPERDAFAPHHPDRPARNARRRPETP